MNDTTPPPPEEDGPPGTAGPPDEDLLDRELRTGPGDLGASLRALLEPPGDIRDRTSDVIGRSLTGTSTFAVAADLLGLGWRTARTILSDDPAPADGGSEGTEP